MRGIILDFNGVLFEDMHLHTKAWQRCSEKFRGKPLSEDELDICHGVNKDIWKYFLGRELRADEIDYYTEFIPFQETRNYILRTNEYYMQYNVIYSQ